MSDCFEDFEEYVLIRRIVPKKLDEKVKLIVSLSSEESENKSFFGRGELVARIPNISIKTNIEMDELPLAKGDSREVSWAIDSMNVDQRSFINGSTVKLAVIDSGIYLDHPSFINKTNLNCINLVGNSNNCTGDHGTAVTSLICGDDFTLNGTEYKLSIAPGIQNINFYRIVDVNDESTNMYRILRALIYAYEDDVDIINISYNFLYSDISQYCDFGQVKYRENIIGHIFARISLEFKKIINLIQKYSKIVIIVSSGNDKRNSNIFNLAGFPAFLDNTISIGSLSQQRSKLILSDFSNGCVDFVVPGSNLLTAYKTNKVKKRNGTSFAAANATGVIALWIDFFKKSGLTDYSINNLMYYLYGSASYDQFEFVYGYKNVLLHYGYGCLKAPNHVNIKSNNKFMKKNKHTPGTTTHELDLLNYAGLEVKVRGWHKEANRYDSSGNFNDVKADIIVDLPAHPNPVTRQPDPKPKTIFLEENTVIDFIVDKTDEIRLSTIIEDQGIEFKLEYDEEGGVLDVNYVIVKSESKDGTIDFHKTSRHSYQFKYVGEPGGGSSHISGNIGHPGGGNPDT